MKEVFLLHEELKEIAVRFPQHTVLEENFSFRTRKINYQELLQAIETLRNWLWQEKIRKSDRVGLILENRIEWAIIYFAIISCGAMCVPLDPQTNPDDLLNILADAEPKMVFISEQIADSFKDIFTQLIFIKKVIVIGHKKLSCYLDFSSIFKSNIFLREKLNLPQINLDDVCSLLYTSGTTDLPKGVMLTHRNLSSNFSSLKKTNLCKSSDNILAILPLFHSYAFMVTLMTPLFLRARAIFTSLDPKDIIFTLKTKEITVFIGVPQIFYLLHKRIKERLNSLPLLKRLFFKLLSNFFWQIRKLIKINLAKFIFREIHKNFSKRLRFLVSGGARLDPYVQKDFFKWGFTLLQGYGLTETSPVVSITPLRRVFFGSVGIPLKDVEVRIHPKEKKVGEILIKGPNVMKGYFKKPLQTQEVLKEGWFYSGDLGYFDEKGNLYISGRKKEVIVLSSGKNIYPEEIESHYLKSPFIKEICIIPIEKESKETLFAIVVPNLEAFRELSQIGIYNIIKSQLELLSRQLPSYKRIMGFEIISEELPRTRLGKIKRYKVKQMYYKKIEQRHKIFKSSPEEVLATTQIAQKIIGYLSKKTHKEKIGLSDNLELDLGIDSLARLELSFELESMLNIKLPDNFFEGIFTVKDLILKIMDLLPEYKQLKEKSLEFHWRDFLNKPLPSKLKKKIRLSPTLVDKFLTLIIPKVIFLFFRLFYRFKVYGKENLKNISGPCIFCLNHTSYFDGFILVGALPYNIELNLFFLGHRAYFEFFPISRFIKSARIIPIDQTKNLLKALQSCAYILRYNKHLCIFPEAERSIDGKIKEFKEGVGILVEELKVSIVPALIKGAYEAWPRSSLFPRFSKKPIKIIFSNILEYNDLIKNVDKSKNIYTQIASLIRDEILKLR